MEPVKFKRQNTVFAENQDEYLAMPAHVADGVVTACWKLSIYERFLVLVGGVVWTQILTGNNAPQPHKTCAINPIEAVNKPDV